MSLLDEGAFLWAGTMLLSLLFSTAAPAKSLNQTQEKPLRVALLGFGAINSEVGRAIKEGSHGLEKKRVTLVKVLIRTKGEGRQGDIFTTSFEELMEAQPDIIVEAAGQPSVRQYGAKILSQSDVLLTSIGALTDDSVLSSLVSVAEKAGTKIHLASGAMPALDWMHASSLGGGDAQSVEVEQLKPPKSWLGACVKGDDLDFNSLTEDATVFEGNAREAASLFPKNANVSAMLGLSTVGLDKCSVKLVAALGDFGTTVKYSGEAGSLEVKTKGKQSKTNPRTSAVVPLAVIKAIKNMTSVVVIGA